jgi:chromosome segregation ATPase
MLYQFAFTAGLRQLTHPQNVLKKQEKVNMSDLNEKLAQEAAELINGGEWRDGKWYSEGHRDAWRRALKPAADHIEKLAEDAKDWERACDGYAARVDELEAALREITVTFWDRKEIERIVNEALERKDD